MHTQLLLAGTQWAQLFVALSALILLHEGGHFLFAKLFKTRVEKFYLFFDFLFPFSGLLNFSLFKWTKGGTQYGIGWFPLGGYVKIAGMVDESMDKDALAKPPEPWEYRSKPAWQRLLIMLGGIIVNIFTAILIYMFVFGVWGEDYLPVQNAKYGIMTDSLGESIGLRNGDKIVSIDGKPVERFNRIMGDLILNQATSLEVSRDGELKKLPIPAGTIRKILKGDKEIIAPRVPTVVAEIAPHSEAANMKLRANDSIIAINGNPVFFFDDVRNQVEQLKGQPIRISVMRGSQLAVLDGKVGIDGKLGFARFGEDRFLEMAHIKYGPIAAIGKGFSFTWHQFANYLAQFKMIFTSKEVKASESLGGIGTFAKIFPTSFDWHSFLMLVAFISIILAFMNLLPIPGLDGGYVIFLLYEIITGRQVKEKVMEYATTVGLVLLLVLMLYANGLDVFRAWFKH
ncbi:MAG: RIP metalloprotease RseP [Chitinophagaceae bacterium]